MPYLHSKAANAPLFFVLCRGDIAREHKMWPRTFAQNVALIASNFASKKFNLHSKMGRVVVFRGNVYTK